MAFQTIRDQLLFTNKRIISIDVQGLTGKRKSFASMPYSKYSISRFKPPALLSWSPIQNCLLCSVTGLPQNLNSKEIQILARLEGWFQNLCCDHNPEQSLPRQVLRWAAEEVLRQEWIALCVKDLRFYQGEWNGISISSFCFSLLWAKAEKWRTVNRRSMSTSERTGNWKADCAETDSEHIEARVIAFVIGYAL